MNNRKLLDVVAQVERSHDEQLGFVPQRTLTDHQTWGDRSRGRIGVMVTDGDHVIAQDITELAILVNGSAPTIVGDAVSLDTVSRSAANFSGPVLINAASTPLTVQLSSANVLVVTSGGNVDIRNGNAFNVYSDDGTTKKLTLQGTTGDLYFGTIASTNVSIRSSTGSPEGVVTAKIGSLFLRSDGSGAVTAYLKTSGTGNTGWDAIDTISGAQTLSNKTLDNTSTITVKDANLTIQDDADTSKQAKFQASGITASTTRTYTLPNATGNLGLAALGYMNPPGPVVSDATSVTALVTQQCGARYLGYTTTDLSAVEINVKVTTAVATSIIWAEVALASGASATSASLTLIGSATSVTATFNSLGVKTVTISATIPAGTFLYVLFGSQATTPFQLRATIADELNLGVVRLASTTRPSTMAAPTTFASSAAITGAAAVGFRWS